MHLAELHALAHSGDFEAALAAADAVEGTDAELLEARCVKAWCHSRLGDQTAARAEAEHALTHATVVLGATHRVTLEALNDVARFSARCGDLPAAISHGANAYTKRRAALGAEHPKTLTSLANLLRYRTANGETVPSSEIDELKAGWQAADPEVIDPAHLNAWALWVELTGDSSDAAACLARFVGVLGENHPDTLRATEQLAALTFGGDDQV